MSGSRSFLRLWFSFVLLGLVWLIWPTAVGASSISAPDRVALPPGLADVASRSSHEGGILRAQSPFASAFNGPTAFAYDAASETAPSRILDPERSSAIAVGLQGGAVHLVGSAGYLYDSTADFVAPRTADDFVNLASDSRSAHILDGHRAGAGLGKSEFPAGWSDELTLNHVSDIATDPTLTWVQQTGKAGAEFTKNGVPVKYVVDGVRDGVTIRVIIQSGGEGIITAFPIG